jgi:hypothetical protein
MRIDAYALRIHAAEVSLDRVNHSRSRLRKLTLGELRTVETVADAVGQAVATYLLEASESDTSVAAALADLYPVGNGTARG